MQTTTVTNGVADITVSEWQGRIMLTITDDRMASIYLNRQQVIELIGLLEERVDDGTQDTER